MNLHNNISRVKLVAVGTLATLTAPMAFAQAQGGFDQAAVIAKITEYGLVAVAIVGAFILARWGVKAMGLMK